MTLINQLQILFGYRILLLKAAKSEIKQKYAGTVLGLWWMVLTPLIFLVIYAIVYSVIFKVRSHSMSVEEYILYIFAGLVPYLHFSEAISVGAVSLSQNRQLFKNTIFPIELIPARAVISNSTGVFVGFFFVVLGVIALQKYSFYLLLVPVVLGLQFLFIIGISWILSLINLIMGDTKNILAFIIMVGMILSPIAYTIEMVPKQLSLLIWLNPFAYFILTYQHLIVLQDLPPTHVWVIMTAFSVFTFLGGLMLFNKIKQVVVSYAG